MQQGSTYVGIDIVGCITFLLFDAVCFMLQPWYSLAVRGSKYCEDLEDSRKQQKPNHLCGC